jgi:type I restriction-modification system DNA methylase subunit
MPAPDRIKQLVETFEQNIDEYRSHKNETELRRQFLDPFFDALGWDVDNKKGASESEKEVAHEFSVEIEGQQKKADYAFRASKESKGKFDFLVEAKKPSVKVEFNLDAAFQIRRYGWSAGISINILTDFEHFAIYDCRVKPKYGEKAALNRLTLIHYKDYLEKWDEIASLFSPEAIRNGSLSGYVKSIKGKKGTADVDDDFLQEIERWRELLAKSIASNNDWIDISGLNYAVQMVIDRIVFLRICEERSIEPENQLQDIANKENIYKELIALFKRADTKYNSGLFHFAKEEGQASRPDDLTSRLDIDDKTLKDIILNLYYPKSPYAFLYIPSDILGQVYERFLGKVIRLTEGHRAKVEEKPEVKKAGGVFYTPTFIVENIVIHTLGKLLMGLTPKEAAKLKIVDPACGSGTFLLGAYQYLLDWHLKWYMENDPEKWAGGKSPAVYQSVTYQRKSEEKENFEGRRVIRESVVDVKGEWRLTTAKKKEILLNNIFGVDIDPQAVEVTKLSLLLKVLEDLNGQLTLGMDRLLPDLGNNIKCGNSLVGEDYFEGKLMAEQEERNRVNPFDWEDAFPEVFAQEGFDAVIGNPPYIRIQAMQEWAAEQVEYFKRKYKAASKGNYDIYVVFIEKALSLLNEKGKMGFILPHKFFNAQYGEPARDLISQGKHISKIVHFGDQQVFHGATTYTCLLFLNTQSQSEFEFTKVSDLENWRNFNSKTSEVSETSEVSGTLNAANITSAEWNFSAGKSVGLFERLSQMPIKLGDVGKIFVGTQTSADDVFVLNDCVVKGNFVEGMSKSLEKRVQVEKKIVVPFLYGKQIRKCQPTETTSFLVSPYEISNNGCRLFTPQELQKFPKAYSYLLENKDALGKRENGKFKGVNWYSFGYPKSMHLFQKEKIIVPDYNNVPSFTFDKNQNFYKTGYGILVENFSLSPLYILGLLNSKLLFHYLLSIGTTLRGGYVRFWTQFIKQLPIRPINFDDPAEKSAHDKIVALVEAMLEFHKRLATAQNPQTKESLEKQIGSTDKAIDKLVYELYGLSGEEIKIVEGSR